MSDFSRTFSIASDIGTDIPGLTKTSFEIAGKLQIDCEIVIKKGWLYYITFSGDEDKVTNAIREMDSLAERYNKRKYELRQI